MTNKAKKSIVAEQLKKIIDDRGLKQKKLPKSSATTTEHSTIC